MGRMSLALVALALGGVVAVAAASGGAAHRYSRSEVRHAFAAQGLRLSSKWLHAFVSPKGTIEVDVGKRPAQKCHSCMVVHFPAPAGHKKAHIEQFEQGNVSLVYLAGHGVGPRVTAALAALRSYPS